MMKSVSALALLKCMSLIGLDRVVKLISSSMKS